MIIRIFSVLLSALCAFAGIGGGAADKIVSGVLGVPVSESSVNESFLEELGDEDVAAIDSEAGYIKNIIILFLENGISPVKKYRFMKENGLKLAGWFCPAGLYAAWCAEGSLAALSEKCEQLEKLPEVAFASPAAATANADTETPDDPFDGFLEWDESSPSGSNWWLEAIDARRAWDYSEYFSKITVGVVDSGVNKNHEDLIGKVAFPDAKSERQNLPGSHGTHVAGIIGATHNNGKGIAGICDNCTLMCSDWQSEKGQIWINDLHILFGFLNVAKAGAKVINFSLGSASGIKFDLSHGFDVAMKLDAAIYSAAMSSLLSKGYDFVVVQSAGNGNSSGHAVDSFYNGTFSSINTSTAKSIKNNVSVQDIVDRIIIVSAAESKYSGIFSQTYYSNVGSGVSIAAPGAKVFSLDTEQDGYCFKSGTSMAAPIVTGTAALVWSVDPTLTGAEVKKIVCSEENTKYTVSPWNTPYFENLDYRDYRMVNTALSVEAALAEKYDMGRVEGTLPAGQFGEVEATVNGTAKTFTVGTDGAFSFLLEAGEVSISAQNENTGETQSFNFTLESGKTVNINDSEL